MRTIIILLIVSFPAITKAQFQLGVHAGLNFSKTLYIGSFESFTTGTKPDIFLGISNAIELSSRLSVLGEVQYSRKGHTVEFADGEAFLRYEYLDIIPQLEYRVVGPFAFSAGVNFGLKLAERSKLRDGQTNKLANTISPTDLGLVLTAKVDFTKFYGFIRYNRGISDISNLEINGQLVEGVLIDVNQFNRNWQIGFGYNLL